MSTMSALSRATSVPDPIAIPTVAATRAGASFTPSPIMATRLAFDSASTQASLPSGRRRPWNTSTPRSLRDLFGRARRISREHVRFHSQGLHLRHGALRLWTRDIGHGDRTEVRAAPHHEHRRGRPCVGEVVKAPPGDKVAGTQPEFPRNRRGRARPGQARTKSRAGSGDTMCRSSVCRTMARPMGCSDRRSAMVAAASTRSADTPAAGYTARTRWSPNVTVPVLSSTTVSIPHRLSR